MAPKRITKLIKSSGKKIKRFKDSVSKLKQNQIEEQEKQAKRTRSPKEKKPDELVISFSPVSVAKATLIVMGLYLLGQFLADIADILIIFFISILFAAAIDPTVDVLERKKIPRSISVIGMFILLIGILVFFVSQLIPLVASQLIEIAKNLGTMLTGTESDSRIVQTINSFANEFLQEFDKEILVENLKESLEGFAKQLQSFAGNTVGLIVSIFNGILNFALVLILTFFLVIDEKGVNEFFLSLFPSKHGKYIIQKMDAVKHKVGYWLRGQIIMMIIMFIVSLIGFMILDIEYALTLAMLIGIGELIPIIGGTLAGIPAVLVAFNVSPWLALWVIAFLFVVQQIEGNVLVPLVMRKAVGLSPIIIILAMLVGYTTLGILGAIIAIPVATALSIFVMDYTAKKK